jgi:hypothetical protein
LPHLDQRGGLTQLVHRLQAQGRRVREASRDVDRLRVCCSAPPYSEVP